MAGVLKGAQPLLKLDYRAQARQAPFQLDAATGKLHRRGCASIPRGSHSALYGVWRFEDGKHPLACSRCKPMPEVEKKPEDPEFPTDILFGVISVMSQFGGVLRERGQEYRKSNVGKILGTRINKMYREINERERNILDVMLASLDELAGVIRSVDADLGTAPQNGAQPSGPADSSAQKPQKKTRRRTRSGSG